MSTTQDMKGRMDTVYRKGHYVVVLDEHGFTVYDERTATIEVRGGFIGGPFSQRFVARRVADLWAEHNPEPHSALWWELYRESNPQLDQGSLANIAMLIRRAKS